MNTSPTGNYNAIILGAGGAGLMCAVVASGRSDLPNQINNVLAFPGMFRGLLDARAREISDGMLLAAAEAIAGVVKDDQLNANYIIPSVFDPAVTSAVATAVAEQARQEPGATAPVSEVETLTTQ